MAEPEIAEYIPTRKEQKRVDAASAILDSEEYRKGLREGDEGTVYDALESLGVLPDIILSRAHDLGENVFCQIGDAIIVSIAHRFIFETDPR